jgi:hypothetical protein
MVSFLFYRGFFQMPTELEPHGRQQLVLEIRVTARTESFVQGRCEHWHWNAFVDGGLNGPSTLARV